MPRFFGKDYCWGMVNGRLVLEKAHMWDVSPASHGVAFTYADLVEGLRRIEAEGGVSYAGAESQGRISLGYYGKGVSDPQAGGDAGRSDSSITGAARDTVAREEGDRAQEGVGVRVGTCTSCWFDSHTGCWGPARCSCWKCYGEDEEC